MITLLATIFFGLGLIIGSFLNVVIFRLHTERSFGGRSMCLSCGHQLCWFELFPLFSFLALRGRCRKCKTKLSWQYPVVEFASGVIFAALFLKFQDVFFASTLSFAIVYAYYAAMFSILLVISGYDLRHKIIPDILALFLGVLAFAGIFFFDLDTPWVFAPHMPGLWDFLAGILLAAPFALLWLVSRGRWMGLGDAKLAVGLGWMLGGSRLLSAAVLSFWSGAILGMLLVAFSKKYKMKSELPFAPYLMLGAALAFFFELHLYLFNF